ncbi:unnamed protein product [Anisakis simplex]|uniref:Kinesin-like protein n=1 Tax=Anisakis simplex TaxID=6269 RepID=A0A0M3K5Q1_ANISI|nr:unnamed protein product [Anisakis simplex]
MSSRKRAATPSRRGGKRVDDKEALEVVCRICPYHGNDPCAEVVDEEHVKLIPPSGVSQRIGLPTVGVLFVSFTCMFQQESVYKFSYVLDESDSQKTVFERTTIDLIENLIRGRNSLLFTYGVTGSGKTYTMTGNTTETTTGILPRTLDVIFNSLPNRVDRCVFKSDGRNGFEVRSELEATLARRRFDSNRSNSIELTNRFTEKKRVSGASDEMLCAVFVSYVEVYNDICYDLLDEPVLSRDGSRTLPAKDIRLGVNNMVYVENAVELEVDSSDEALELFYRGQERRRVADTLLNKQSSRSHSIFNIRLVMAPCKFAAFHPDSDPNKIHISQLSLVDLAGSERTKRTGNEGIRLAETGKINQSLLVLRQCFEKLRENQRNPSTSVPVPYRESKITHLFKNYFEGTGKVRMIICINPTPNDYAENVGVMGFAELSQSIEVLRGTEVSVPVGDGLPISRRDYIKWSSEIENLVPKPVCMNLFDVSPPFELKGSNDIESITRLRVFYQNALRKRDSYTTEYEVKENDFETQLKRTLCLSDLQLMRIKELENERDEAERSMATLMAQLRQSRRENQALRHRIGRYEAEENDKASQEEELRKRERGYQEQLRKKEKTLHQVGDYVRELFEKSPSARKQFVSSENVNRVGFAQSNEQIAGPSGIMKSALKQTATTNGNTRTLLYPSLFGERQNLEHERGRLRIAQRPGFYNAKYHRRSKSANGRVIDHQPRVHIPEGTYMQVRDCCHSGVTLNSVHWYSIRFRAKSSLANEKVSFGTERYKNVVNINESESEVNLEKLNIWNFQPRIPGAHRSTKVEISDLQKSSEYVLTHQEVDTEGNLTTQLVKGDCIPTAGGGTAVRFNDVERLSHESPEGLKTSN